MINIDCHLNGFCFITKRFSYYLHNFINNWRNGFFILEMIFLLMMVVTGNLNIQYVYPKSDFIYDTIGRSLHRIQYFEIGSWNFVWIKADIQLVIAFYSAKCRIEFVVLQIIYRQYSYIPNNWLQPLFCIFILILSLIYHKSTIFAIFIQILIIFLKV